MDSVRALHNAQGQRLLLGRELGRGGEGVVHELPAHPDWVAKRYHQPPDAAKQQKLRLMAEAIDSPLRNYAAWPEETLHLGENGPVIGFTMQRIEGRLPIHMLYSPAQRRESFAQARFDFLVFVARNIAAAFATLHEHGHVLGDVNQGNVLVGADSRVILIDCDSFQIQVGEALHRCEVGVAHFTPPELQRIASFEDITRTPNHDAFGLALLIFHLLMGGRHPYSGVPLADHIGESLEADIRDFRYAYARDAAQRLIAPPPKSVPIESLPPEIVTLFEQAFTEPGVESRPTAQQWVGALDALRAQLQACAKNALHIHADVIGECVWCEMDRRHVTLFGGLSRPVAKAEPKLGLDLDAMEAEISQMKLAEPVEMPGFAMPPSVSGWHGRRFPLWPTIGFGLYMSAVLGHAFLPSWLMIPMVVVGFAMIGISNLVAGNGGRSAADDRYARERFEQAEQRLRQSVASINAANGSALLGRWRSAVRELRAHLLADVPPLTLTAQAQAEPGLRAFLGTHKLAQWKDAQRFTMQRILLDASGIETAADFDRASLDRLRMIEAAVRDSLLQWRSELVQSYRQRIAAAPTAASREMLQRRHRRQRTLEVEVQEAYAKLRQARPPQLAVSSERTREFMALKAEASKLHARWLGSSNRI